MTVNGKSDILSDILRSLHNETTVRHQESNDLNELDAQHPGKGCQPSQNAQTSHPTKMPKFVAWRKREKLPDIQACYRHCVCSFEPMHSLWKGKMQNESVTCQNDRNDHND